MTETEKQQNRIKALESALKTALSMIDDANLSPQKRDDLASCRDILSGEMSLYGTVDLGDEASVQKMLEEAKRR